MICAVSETNRPDFESACAAAGFWETRLPVDLALFGNSPASGWQFMTAPGGAIALRPGASAVLCGRCDAEELGSLLGFLGVEKLTAPAGQPCPEGFCEGEVLTCFAAAEKLPAPACRVDWQLRQELSPKVSAGLLSGLDEEARMNFFAECCARRNHGQGVFWGAQVGEEIVTAVSTCAVSERFACMFAGETLPAWRGRGIGGALIAAMANHWLDEGRTPCFVARPERVRFYTRLGFVPLTYYKEYIYKESYKC